MATPVKKAAKPAVKDKALKQPKDKEQKDTIARESLIVEDAVLSTAEEQLLAIGRERGYLATSPYCVLSSRLASSSALERRMPTIQAPCGSLFTCSG